MMAPSKERIAEIFGHLATGDTDKFFSYVDDNVGKSSSRLPCVAHANVRLEWTVMSQSTLGGTYHSKSAFREKTMGRLAPLLDQSTPMRITPHNVIGGGDSDEWCTVEMKNEGKANNGMRYDQTYAWCVRWKQNEELIVQVRAYLDTGLVDRLVQSNEH